jgi:hypothetical protein
MKTRARARHATVAVVWLMLAAAAPGRAQTVAPDAPLYRIFLTDGSTVVSYGDFARVADRVVFSIPLGGLDGPSPTLHLASLAESAVDWERTDRYAHATRARRYAATRGEADFDHLSSRVAQALSDVALTKDPAKRLALATEARRMLGAWPAAHYGYRAGDVAQLAALLDDAVGELRVAAGLSRFDLTLVAINDGLPPDEPELPAPTANESLDQAFRAASIVPDATERVSLLEAIMESLGPAASEPAWASAVRERTSAALAAEMGIEREYRELVTRTIATANERTKKADVTGLETLLRSVLAADDRLGRKRPETTAALLATLDGRLDAARRLRLARDSWAIRQERVADYERRIRPALQGFRRSSAGLEQIRQLAGPSPGALQPLATRLNALWRELKTVTPTAETEPAHSMFLSAVQLAIRAAASRRLAITATDMSTAWEASSAAAGALMMFERAQEELRKLTTPPGL